MLHYQRALFLSSVLPYPMNAIITISNDAPQVRGPNYRAVKMGARGKLNVANRNGLVLFLFYTSRMITLA